MESVIKWQTGVPTKPGWYIVSIKDNKVTYDLFTESHNWLIGDVIAWYSLSEIEPYKE